MKKASAGFTLLEVMLVVLLMGVAATAVTFTMGDSGPKQTLTKAAEQFIASVDLVLDETVLSGQFLGVVVDEDKYQFVIYQDEKWQPLQDDRLLSSRQMKPEISLSLVLEGLPLVQEDEEDESFFDEPFEEADVGLESGNKKPIEPQILLFPSGEMSSFDLAFIYKSKDGQELQLNVIGDALGRLSLGDDNEAR